MKRWVAAAPLLALLAIVASAFAILSLNPEKPEVQQGLVGGPSPRFALAPLDGTAPVTQATFAGRPHLINFFASWCAPCRFEHPLLLELEAEGALILGVAYKDKPEAVSRLLARDGDPFAAVGLDPTGRLGLDLGITAVPETYVVDADGVLLFLHRGPLTEDIVRDKIRPLLKLPPVATATGSEAGREAAPPAER